MSKFIAVKLDYEATHNWPECPIEEVSYLKNEHRHMFRIEILKEVTHNDRDVEIIMFKNRVLSYLNAKYNHKLERRSCEDLAEDILSTFECHQVTVLEDNENGALITKY